MLIAILETIQLSANKWFVFYSGYLINRIINMDNNNWIHVTMYKQMNSGSSKNNVTSKLSAYIYIYI